MAFHNREWDRGKDNWIGAGDGGGWGGNARPREDEYQGDWKRRKFNNGAYDASQRDDYGGFPQGDSNNDFGYDDRQQRSGVRKRLLPSEATPHVIFLGLDPDFTEADLQAFLSGKNCSVETVTIIRDRSTGLSKGFGFAQFTSTEHARAFVDPLFPFIQIPPPASHGATAKTTFFKALETGIPHNGRRVKIDYSQSASPHEKGRMRQNMNEGTRDIGNAPGPVLLFRGLDPLSGPQAIYQSMLNSAGAGKEGAKGMRRIILIKDKVTMASYGFAFVEFVDTKSSSAVLANTMSPQVHPEGFRISDRPVAVSFAHPYSFQPVDHFARDEACLACTTTLCGTDVGFCRYWDETSTVAHLDFEVEQPAQEQAAATNIKKKKAKDVEPIKLAEPAKPSELPISDKPVTLSFNKTGPVKLSVPTGPVQKKSESLGFSLNDEANESGDEKSEQANGDDKARTGKVAPLIVSKKVANNISKWNQVQEVLSTGAENGSTSSIPTPVVSAPAPASTSTLKSEPDFEFSDQSAKTCLLCARQFKSLDQLKRHNKESDLHKKNYKDANLREVARQKARTIRGEGADNSDSTAKYRDRASERRIMHNQPEHIPHAPSSSATQAEPAGGNNGSKKRYAPGPVAPPPLPAPEPALNPGEDEKNVGNKLLKMMGWTEGSGLGAEGEGRVEPIQTAIFEQGVGLGASKGKEIGKYADGYAGYVQMGQDTTRQRYGASD